MMVQSSLKYINHKVTEFLIPEEVKRAVNHTAVLDFQSSEFNLFSNLINRVVRQFQRAKESWMGKRKTGYF